MKHFHSFRLDTVNECLWRGDERVTLTRKAFAIARYLVDHAGRLITKEELMEAVWPNSYVQEENLKAHIKELRRALGDQAGTPSFIETQRGRGYRFIAPVTEGAPVTAAPAGDRSFRQLSGREAELGQLRGWFEQAASGERQIVFVTGEAGIGKTALAEAFLQRTAAQQTLRIAAGQCIESYREQEAYYPVLEALGRLCREADGQLVVEVLSRFAPTWLVQFPALVTPERRQTLQREILGATRERMLREICEAVEALTAEVPLILLLEDLHWTDYSTLDFISALARRRDPARLMLLATYRPVEIVLSQHPLRQLKQELLTRHLCRELPLELLDEKAVTDYLAARFPGSAIPAELAHAVHEQTEGKPLFMVAAVDFLVARGMIAENGAAAKLNATLDEISSVVPESLQQFIEQQIEQLTPEEQEAMAAASVAGVNFSAWAVAAATGRDQSVVEDCCERLTARQLMLRSAGLEDLPDGSTSARYQFSHSLYREMLYRQCSPIARLRLHQRIGEAMERMWADGAAEIASELASHFQEAHDYARAVRYLRLAAENAAHRYAYRAAVAILESARKAIGKLPESARGEPEIEALNQLAAVHDALGDRLQAAKLYEMTAERAAALGRRDVEAQVLVNLSRELSVIDPLRALEVGERAVQISGQQGSERMRVNAATWASFLRLALYGWRQDLADAHRQGIEWLRSAGESGYFAQHASMFAFVQIIAGDYRGALQTASECLPLLQQTGDALIYFSSYWDRGRALMNLGRWGESLRALREAIALAERNGDAFGAAFGRIVLASLYCEAFDFAGARALCQAALPVIRQSPSKFALQRLLIMSAMAETGLGNYDGALEYLSELRELYDSSLIAFSWYWKMHFHCAFSELWLARGDVTAAREEAERLREHSDRNAERAWQARARQMSARVAIAEQDQPRAEREIADALAVIGEIEAPLVAWRIHETAAELCDLTGRSEQAEDHRRVRNETLLNLAHSLDEDEALRQSLLNAANGTRI